MISYLAENDFIPRAPEFYLVSGIGAVALVVLALWKIVSTRTAKMESVNDERTARLESEHAAMSSRVLILEREAGVVKGKLAAIIEMVRGCPVSGCQLAKVKLLTLEDDDK